MVMNKKVPLKTDVILFHAHDNHGVKSMAINVTSNT